MEQTEIAVEHPKFDGYSYKFKILWETECQVFKVFKSGKEKMSWTVKILQTTTYVWLDQYEGISLWQRPREESQSKKEQKERGNWYFGKMTSVYYLICSHRDKRASWNLNLLQLVLLSLWSGKSPNLPFLREYQGRTREKIKKWQRSPHRIDESLARWGRASLPWILDYVLQLWTSQLSTGQWELVTISKELVQSKTSMLQIQGLLSYC